MIVSFVLQIAGTVFLGGGLFLTLDDPPLYFRTVLRSPVPALVWFLVVLVPQIALSVSRLHDTNRSG